MQSPANAIIVDAKNAASKDALTLPGSDVDQLGVEDERSISQSSSLSATPVAEYNHLMHSTQAALVVEEVDQIDSLCPRLSTLINQSIPERRIVLGSLCERGAVSLLAAASGIGKTTLTVDVMCAVASGQSFAGLAVGRPEKVVYLNVEDAAEEVIRRFQATRLAGRLDDDGATRIHIMPAAQHCRVLEKVNGQISTTGYGLQLRSTVAIIKPALIVIDPLAMAHGLDENSNGEMAALMRYASELAIVGDSAVLLVHHTGKDTKPGLGASRGASSIPASVRSMWQLTAHDVKEGSEPAVQLTCVKTNYHARPADRFFKRAQVVLPNGDAVGLLEPIATGRN